MSAVHIYYRKISENVDNIKNSIDIASLLVKSQEVDSKIYNNELNISENLSLINTNESNITENLSLINTNKSNITENLSLINTNKSNISDNLSLINTNKSNIAENLKLIGEKSDIIEDNKSNIAENLKLIGEKSDIIEDNKSNITENLKLINTNSTTLSNIDTDLYNLRGRINTHQDDIQNLNGKVYNLSDCYKLKDLIIIDIEKTNIAWSINNNNPKFIITQSSLNNNFKRDSYLEFDSSILAFFNKHYINVGFFHILLEYFNDENVLFKSIKMPIMRMVSKHCIITNLCVIKLPRDLDKIYFKLSIKLNNNQNRTDSISILDFDNKIYFKYYEIIV